MGKKLAEAIRVRLDKEDRAKLESLCSVKGMSVSLLIRKIVSRLVNTQKIPIDSPEPEYAKLDRAIKLVLNEQPVPQGYLDLLDFTRTWIQQWQVPVVERSLIEYIQKSGVCENEHHQALFDSFMQEMEQEKFL